MKHKYREAYIQKLESKKVSGDLQKQLDVCGDMEIFLLS